MQSKAITSLKKRTASFLLTLCLSAGILTSLPFAFGTAASADSGSKIEAAANNVGLTDSTSLNMTISALNLNLLTGFTPETLTLTPGKNTSEIGVTWYSDDTAGNGKVKFGNLTVDAASGSATTGKKWHKATITGLTSAATYVYSVSNDGTEFSQEYVYTAPETDEFTFAAVGDPQLTLGQQDGTSNWFSSDKSTRLGWAATVQAMQTKLGDKLNFIAGVGDQVDLTNVVSTANVTQSENEYKNFFEPGLLRNIPFAPAVGNHDRHYGFTYHYNLPNEQTYTKLQGAEYGNATNDQYANVESKGNYYYTYNNALFVVLNDSSYPANKAAAQALVANFKTTLYRAVTANPGYTWLFVQHHKSTASVADHIADRDIQYYVEAGFEKLMDEYKVDFVLGGHDHVYARSYPMKNGTPELTQGGASINNANGTVYMTFTTASGLKYYELFNAAGNLYVKDNADYPYLVNGLQGSVEYAKGNLPLSNAKYLQAKKPAFTAIKVTSTAVSFETYNVDNLDESYDTFRVTNTNNQTAAVIAKINLIPATVTLSDKTKVTEARTAYDALTAEEKELVTNYTKLTAAETTIAALETIKADLTANSFKWNVPTHGQADVAIIGGNNELAKFEFMFDSKRKVDITGTDKWLEDWRKETGLPRGNTTHNHALAAVGYLDANFPMTSSVLPDIKADSILTAADFKEFNDEAPDAAFGAKIYSGSGSFAAKVGGVWDTLLSEGRRYWVFGGEAEGIKTYTKSQANTPQGILDGMRSGNSFTAFGGIITELDYKITNHTMNAAMGETLRTVKGKDTTVTITFIGNVDKIDVVAGEILRAPSEKYNAKTKDYEDPKQYLTAEYQNEDVSATTKVIKALNKSDFKDEGNGKYSVTFTLPASDKDVYYRLIGTNNAGGAFYSNPVFVNAQTDAVTISGTIKDKDGKVLANKTIEFHSDIITTVTDANGKFTLNNTKLGVHTIKVLNASGEVESEITFNLQRGEKTEFDKGDVWIAADVYAINLNFTVDGANMSIESVSDGLASNLHGNTNNENIIPKTGYNTHALVFMLILLLASCATTVCKFISKTKSVKEHK